MKDRFWRFVSIWLLIAVTVWIGDRFIRDLWLTADEPRAVTPRGELASFEQHAIDLFDNVAPSVVYLFTEASSSGLFGAGSRQTGAGSGFVWDAAGHIVTNYHVIEGANRVRVRLDSGEVVDSKLVGAAPDYDLAVVQLDDTRVQLAPIPIGSSGELKVGQAVFAIGNPFGLSRTLTTGIVSALNRRLPTESRSEIAGVIQTDAAINPGNSGGPLLDSSGRLIGVNTSIISGSGSSAGIGFAVPVDTVNRIVPQLIAKGKVPRPGIGIMIAEENMAIRLGLGGLVVADVAAGGSAQRAGLVGIDRRSGRLGDIITHAEGKRLETIADFVQILEDVGIGEQIELTVSRDGRQRTIKLPVIDIS